jgi:hypothetical protein
MNININCELISARELKGGDYFLVGLTNGKYVMYNVIDTFDFDDYDTDKTDDIKEKFSMSILKLEKYSEISDQDTFHYRKNTKVIRLPLDFDS